MSEKPSGVKELRTDGRESGESQVSDRDRMSMFSSVINSFRTVGLSRDKVMEVTEQVLR